MNEIRIAKGTKHMKLNFYIPQSTPKRAGGERNTHFKFIDHATEMKRVRKNTRNATNTRLNTPIRNPQLLHRSNKMPNIRQIYRKVRK